MRSSSGRRVHVVRTALIIVDATNSRASIIDCPVGLFFYHLVGSSLVLSCMEEDKKSEEKRRPTFGYDL